MWTPYSEGRGGLINGFKLRELFRAAARRGPHVLLRRQFRVQRQLPLLGVAGAFTSEVQAHRGSASASGGHHLQSDCRYQLHRRTRETSNSFRRRRVAYNLNDKWAVAVEEYADFGPLRHFDPVNDQFHEVWAVMDHNSKIVNIETGVGFGVTAGADKLTFKLMLSRDLNSRHQN